MFCPQRLRKQRASHQGGCGGHEKFSGLLSFGLKVTANSLAAQPSEQECKQRTSGFASLSLCAHVHYTTSSTQNARKAKVSAPTNKWLSFSHRTLVSDWSKSAGERTCSVRNASENSALHTTSARCLPLWCAVSWSARSANEPIRSSSWVSCLDCSHP